MPAAPPAKVVLVHRYFFPDNPPYAHILEAIAARLAHEGHEVTVLTCQPSYRPTAGAPEAASRERRNGYEVVRWPVLRDRTSRLRKLANLIWFCARLVGARSYFRKADVVMAATTPPIVLALVVSWLARMSGARFVYHKQDIYPEVLGSELSWPLRALRRLDARTEAGAASVVALSDDMASTVKDRTRRRARVAVINNFDPWHSDEIASERGPRDSKFRLVFGGNLGHFQGLDQLRELIEMVAEDPRIEFHFFGDGARAREFESLSERLPSVVLHGFRPAEEVAEFVRDTADLGIVCLEPGVIRAAYPSKTMTYLRNGCPVLTLVEPSELSAMVTSEGVGVTGSWDELDKVSDTLRRLADDPSELESARARACLLYRERFAAERQLDRWADLVNGLVAR